jgi:inosine/xanthosine triphosphate pyrophosphatase family protein
VQRQGEVVVATHNPGKKEHYSKLFEKFFEQVFVLSDLGITEKPEEMGATAEENARIKAVFYAKLTGKPVFAEDASVFVDFLPEEKQPGVNVRRVGGRELTDDELLAHWEAIVSKVPEEKRTGYWHIAYCFAFPGGNHILFAIDQPRKFFFPPSTTRISGWPMSSLQGPIKFNKPHSELNEEEKKEFHREANEMLIGKLKEIFQELQIK